MMQYKQFKKSQMHDSDQTDFYIANCDSVIVVYTILLYFITVI